MSLRKFRPAEKMAEKSENTEPMESLIESLMKIEPDIEPKTKPAQPSQEHFQIYRGASLDFSFLSQFFFSKIAIKILKS